MYIAASSAHLFDETERLHYLSQCDSLDVATGTGTTMLEAKEDSGNFDAVVLSLGGGELAAAFRAWCSTHALSCELVDLHPEIFGRQSIR